METNIPGMLTMGEVPDCNRTSGPVLLDAGPMLPAPMLPAPMLPPAPS